MMKLQEQLLSTVAGLVRRDCNYYNIDKIRTECTWDQDRTEWNLPRVTVTKTSLSPVSSHKSMQRKKSESTSTLPSSSTSLATKMIGSSPSTSPRGNHITIIETHDEGVFSGCGEELDYFKPKRALALLAEGAQFRANNTVNTSSVDGGLSWKHGRLQSLPSVPASHHPVPHSTLQHGPQSMTHHDVLETVERKKSKWRSLEPLGDPHKRRP